MNQYKHVVTILHQRCKGCGLCVDACPKNVLALSRESNLQGINYAVVERIDECIGCRFCGEICPDCCVTVEREANAS